MSRTIRTAAVAATGAVALGIGIGIGGLASADPTASPTPAAPASPSASASADPGAPSGGPAGRRGPAGREDDRDGGRASELASKLGVDEAKVRTALREYRQANGPTSRPEPGSKPDEAARAAADKALAAALADTLGIDEAKVATALEEIRAARQAERTKAVEDRLATAVEDGTLTQAEADAVKKAADAGIVHVGR